MPTGVDDKDLIVRLQFDAKSIEPSKSLQLLIDSHNCDALHKLISELLALCHCVLNFLVTACKIVPQNLRWHQEKISRQN